MKTKKILSIVAFCVITTMLLSSCGIMKNNDFSSQKYTNFKKGKTTVIINPATKENKDADLIAVVNDQKKITEVAEVTSDKTSQITITPKPDVKIESGKTANQINSFTKETKKDKINRAASFVKDRLVNRPNTASSNDEGLSAFWVVVLVLLILWAVGLWGFGIGGLINILLVIALVLLILWLLEVI